MQDQLTHFYLDKEEPLRGTLLALHDYILAFDAEIRAAWKWNTPFFTYLGKNLCYLWMDKKTGFPYIGFIDGHKIEHPMLLSGDRKQIKVLLIHPEEDFPQEAMEAIFAEALEICEGRGKK